MPTLLVLGTRNLGGAIAERFAALGYSVAGVSRSEESAARFRERVPEGRAFVADVSRAADLERVVAEVEEAWGRLDLAVNAITSGSRKGPFGGGPLLEADPEAITPFTSTLVPAVYQFFRVCGKAMAPAGSGTLVQVTGGSALRGMPGRAAWAAAAFASRAIAQAAAQELRESGVHAALLVVDAVIASDKTRAYLEGRPPEAATRHEDVVGAIEYLVQQDPRGWTHELRLTPRLDRWIP